MKKIILSILVSIISLAQNAQATPVSTGNKATANISSSCTFSGTNINFGVIDPSIVNQTTGTINVLCTKSTNYQIKSNYGAYFAKGTGQSDWWAYEYRMLSTDTSDYILYSLFVPNPTPGRVWGSGSPDDVISGTGNSLLQTYTITAKTRLDHWPKPSDYSDTVTSTISF